MQHILSLVRRCVEDYNMIEDGETVAVGVSGGKDSVLTLAALARLRDFYPKKFQVAALTIDSGTPDTDFSPIVRLCEELEVPCHLIPVPIYEIVFVHRKEKNPCSLCAKLRRGALSTELNRLGISKIALGHHYDDAVETMLMSLFLEGRISCFQPVTYLDRSGVTQIRPLLYVQEREVKGAVRRLALPVVKNPCPANGSTKREEMKELLLELDKRFPNLKKKIFGAIQRYPLYGWSLEEDQR
ncbi:MAG: tRNA 2-thiocytidine biosynthesis protein TtcA [Oscillospiraceae bacterium]|nr:tRNA 2-thiocytidine biosynthesis protein TtcA [Oscillospiraceae bacterium]MCI8877941.1 tRNA 2-thiocytidine biosynthesis protein TtcA [Oscillospiraceae bacterium]